MNGGLSMKTLKTVLTVLAVLAAVAAAVYVGITYGNRIVAWLKKVLHIKPAGEFFFDDADPDAVAAEARDFAG